eukprot:7572990-Ditylum_brightwellii.AAC.1
MHISKKSNIVNAENIQVLLTIKLRYNEPDELACKIWIVLVYFRLLQNLEAFRIAVEGIEFHNEAKNLSINHPYASKYHENGFSFFIPSYFHGTFTRYLNQISNEEGRLLKNFNARSEKQEQNMGLRKVVSFC